MDEQDALLEALQNLTEQTSHAVLAFRAVPGLEERCGLVWNAWHAVRMSYRSPLSPLRVQGVEGVAGFGVQVRVENVCLCSGFWSVFVFSSDFEYFCV